MEIPIENFFPTIEILGRLSLSQIVHDWHWHIIVISNLFTNPKSRTHFHRIFQNQVEAAGWQRRRLHLLWNPHEDWGLSVIEDWNLSFKKDRAQFMSRKSFPAPFAFLTSNKPSISSLLSKQKWHGASNVNTHTKILLPDWLISSGVSTFFRVFTIFWKWGWKAVSSSFSEIRDPAAVTEAGLFANFRIWGWKQFSPSFSEIQDCYLPFSAHSVPTMFTNFRKRGWKPFPSSFWEIRDFLPIGPQNTCIWGRHTMATAKFFIWRHVICEICKKRLK